MTSNMVFEMGQSFIHSDGTLHKTLLSRRFEIINYERQCEKCFAYQFILSWSDFVVGEAFGMRWLLGVPCSGINFQSTCTRQAFNFNSVDQLCKLTFGRVKGNSFTFVVALSSYWSLLGAKISQKHLHPWDNSVAVIYNQIGLRHGALFRRYMKLGLIVYHKIYV